MLHDTYNGIGKLRIHLLQENLEKKKISFRDLCNFNILTDSKYIFQILSKALIKLPNIKPLRRKKIFFFVCSYASAYFFLQQQPVKSKSIMWKALIFTQNYLRDQLSCICCLENRNKRCVFNT